MFLWDDYEFERELSTLISVEEAISKARSNRKTYYWLLGGFVILWAVILAVLMPRRVELLFGLLLLNVTIVYFHLLRIDAHIKILLLRRKTLRESEEQRHRFAEC